MQLCSNDLMEDKVCTNRPVTSIGFWSPFQTVIGAATCDTDAPRHQVFTCCVATLFIQARTQRVISLSSCEAELHGMVSTLCDTVSIKRCADFVIKRRCLEQILLTDSSSARQLCSRQGTGKVKHLSVKILWSQDQVRIQKLT